MNSAFAIALILAATHNDPFYKKPAVVKFTYIDKFAGYDGGAVIKFTHLPKGTRVTCEFSEQNEITCFWEKPE